MRNYEHLMLGKILFCSHIDCVCDSMVRQLTTGTRPNQKQCHMIVISSSLSLSQVCYFINEQEKPS